MHDLKKEEKRKKEEERNGQGMSYNIYITQINSKPNMNQLIALDSGPLKWQKIHDIM